MRIKVWYVLTLLITISVIALPVLAQESTTPASPTPVSTAVPPVAAPVKQPSKTELMIQVVLSDKTELPLRQSTAQLLVQDPQAHQALIDVLMSEAAGNTTAKIIICQAIASVSTDLVGGEGAEQIPLSFIKPLFDALLSENTELSFWAARAIVKCHDGVPGQLAKMTTDLSQSTNHRLACINALELLPGKEPVMALASVLDDKENSIRVRASKALGEMLYLPTVDIQQFKSRYLPKIQAMSETAFLQWQLDRRKEQIRQNETQLQQNTIELEYWQQKYFDTQTDKFNRLADAKEKLDFLNSFLLDQQEESMRVWALQQIVEWSNTTAARSEPIAQPLVNLLAPFINDPSPKVRQLTAIALGRLNFDIVQPTAPALLEQVGRESNPDVTAALLATLGKLEYTPAIDVALQAATSSAEQKALCQEAIRAIGRLSAAKAKPLTLAQVEKAAAILVKQYPLWKESPNLSSEAIQTMQKIGEQKDYRSLANKYFKTLLIASMEDTDAKVRSAAVYALSNLLEQQVLPLLLQNPNRLDDESISVRFAVIAAIESYGGSDHLVLLMRRLEKETDIDAAERIGTAFSTILTSLPIDNAYHWASELRTASETQQSLRLKVLQILQKKIAAAKADGGKVDMKYDVMALSQMAEIARQKKQPEQALDFYQKLLNLEQAEKEKVTYRKAVVQLALEFPTDDMLIAAEAQMPQLNGQLGTILDSISVVSNGLSMTDDKQLVQLGKIVSHLVLPLKTFPSEALASSWQNRAKEIALALTTGQIAQLKETGKDTPGTVDLIKRLTNQLKQYPASGTAEQKLAALGELQKALTPAAATPAETATKEATTVAAEINPAP